MVHIRLFCRFSVPMQPRISGAAGFTRFLKLRVSRYQFRQRSGTKGAREGAEPAVPLLPAAVPVQPRPRYPPPHVLCAGKAPLEATADTDVEPAVRHLVCQYTMHAVLHKRKPPVEWQDPVPKRPRGGAARRQSYSAVQKSEFLSVRLPFAGPRRAEAVAHYTPGGFTEDCQPVDKGAGSNVQMYMSDELDKWLDCDENMEKWEVGS